MSVPEGYEVPIHISLTVPILLGGAPRGLAIINGTLSAAFGLGLFAVGEHALAEPVAVPGQHRLYPVDIGQIRADAEDHPALRIARDPRRKRPHRTSPKQPG